MPHSGIFAFFYIAGKEEWQSMQELIFPVADWKIGWLRYTRHFSIKEYILKNRCTALYPCRG